MDDLVTLYGEMQDRLKYLETREQTEENKWRILEITVAIVRIQRLLLANVDIGKSMLKLSDSWVKYDHDDPKSRPEKYGKYFVYRKDGKVHWETWNGNGWAYNGNVITHWRGIKPPII